VGGDFARMLEAQRVLQSGYVDGDPMTFKTPAHVIDFVNRQFRNIVVECTEALNEVGWKEWANSNHINAEAGMKELVDVWHFMMNWLLALAPIAGIENTNDLATWFVEYYMEKNFTNQQRQNSNYNGFDEKCPQCSREKEMAVWEEEEDGSVKILVCNCGFTFTIHNVEPETINDADV